MGRKYVPGPSKGCQMVSKDLSIHHPFLGFHWHPLVRGAGMSLSISPTFFFPVANCFVFFLFEHLGVPNSGGFWHISICPTYAWMLTFFPIGNTSSFMLDFPASYFSLPEGKNSDRNWCIWISLPESEHHIKKTTVWRCISYEIMVILHYC